MENSTVLHLLHVHVHAPQDFLAFSRPDLVMDVAENRPAGTILGEVKLRGGPPDMTRLAVKLFPVKVRRLVAAAVILPPSSTTTSHQLNRSLSIVQLTSRQPLDHETDPVLKFRLVAVNIDTQGKGQFGI
jgi:hypothetical protein